MKPPATRTAVALTYALGRSLYVPLTSWCNSATLPQTRGSNFSLPRDVVDALMQVRSLERGIGDGTTVAVGEASSAGRGILPPPEWPRVHRLGDGPAVRGGTGDPRFGEEGMEPTVEALVRDVLSRLESGLSTMGDGGGDEGPSNEQYDSLVIAGEGEPTLRLQALLSVARSVRSSSPFRPPTIRVVTNGLCDAVPGNVDGGVRTATRMKRAGVTGVSVALMTGSAKQYRDLMGPCLPPRTSESAHDLVRNFVKDAVCEGMDVEVTGVDRPDVDRGRAEALAAELGVMKPFRWRPYFP